MAEGRGSLIPMAQGGGWAGSDRKQLPKGWSCPCRYCWKLSGQNGTPGAWPAVLLFGSFSACSHPGPDSSHLCPMRCFSPLRPNHALLSPLTQKLPQL